MDEIYKADLEKIKALIKDVDPIFLLSELELIKEKGYDEDYPPQYNADMEDNQEDDWEEEEDNEDDGF